MKNPRCFKLWCSVDKLCIDCATYQPQEQPKPRLTVDQILELAKQCDAQVGSQFPLLPIHIEYVQTRAKEMAAQLFGSNDAAIITPEAMKRLMGQAMLEGINLCGLFPFQK